MGASHPLPESVELDLPFMRPERSLEDLRVINHLVGRLRAALHSGLLERRTPATETVTYEWDDDSQMHQRIIRRMSLDVRSRERIFLVGFFGQRRHDADRTEIQQVDRELVSDLDQHQDILCYFTSALATGEYGNLVLSRTVEARAKWNEDPRHQYAVRELSPRYYHSIRLHNGEMEGGLLCTAGAMLTRTKYYAFDPPGSRPRRSERDWSPPLKLIT